MALPMKVWDDQTEEMECYTYECDSIGEAVRKYVDEQYHDADPGDEFNIYVRPQGSDTQVVRCRVELVILSQDRLNDPKLEYDYVHDAQPKEDAE